MPTEENAAGSLRQILDSAVLGNTVEAWLLAALTAALAFASVYILRGFILRRARTLAERKHGGIFGLIPRMVLATSVLVPLAVAIYAASFWITLPASGQKLVRGVVVFVVALQAVMWGRMLIDFGLDEFLRRRALAAGLTEPDGPTLASAGILRVIAIIALYAAALLLALDNLDIRVTAMIAGLGIGGIAIALAVQNILGDLFASLSIVLDKPFVVGDFIIVGEQLGTVEKIGLKTTRLRSLSGEQLIFANSDLLNSRVRNFKRMEQRRVVFNVGVTYQTPADKLEQIPAVLKEAVCRLDKVKFDRAHFKAFAAYSLDFEIVYHVMSSDFNVYMDKQQAINLHIYRTFAEMGVEFAYPTQTLYLADGAVRVSHQPTSNGTHDGAGRAAIADRRN